MPLSMTPGSSIIASPELRCRHRLRRDLSGSALPILPAIRFTRGKYLGASRFPHLLRPAKLLAPPVRIRPIYSATGGFYFQASNGSVALPVAGYDYNSDWTPLLAGLSPARMSASLAAPDPYLQLSRIRFPPRVLTIKHCGLTHASQPRPRVPGSESGRCMLARLPLGPCPSPPRLRRRCRFRVCFVRRFPRYYDRARLPAPVHHRLRLLTFPMRTVPLTRR